MIQYSYKHTPRQGVKINLIDERTRAELPLRDVRLFCHFPIITDETIPLRGCIAYIPQRGL